MCAGNPTVNTAHSVVTCAGADNWPRPNMNTPPLLPEDVIDAALTKAVSTLGLAGLAQDQAAGLAAVFGFWSQQEVVSESSMKRHEACRDTWTKRHTWWDFSFRFNRLITAVSHGNEESDTLR